MAVLTESMRKRIEEYIPRYPNKQAVTLPALHIVQEELQCVPLDAMKEIAEILDLHPSQVYDTVSFYGFFRLESAKLGAKRLWVCRSISCMLRGGEELLADICHKYDVKPGGTTKDGKLTIEFAECLGACEGAPCVLVNDECHMNVTADSVEKIVS